MSRRTWDEEGGRGRGGRTALLVAAFGLAALLLLGTLTQEVWRWPIG